METGEWIGLAGVIVPTAAVGLAAWLNHRATESTNKSINRRFNDVDRRAESHGEALQAIARDVSFMAGRQAERDRPVEGDRGADKVQVDQDAVQSAIKRGFDQLLREMAEQPEPERAKSGQEGAAPVRPPVKPAPAI